MGKGRAVKTYWEIIADELTREGWTWGTVFYFTGGARKMHVADAHRDDGRRFIVHAESKGAAFLELQTQCRAAGVAK
jgi:hypothetical protein